MSTATVAKPIGPIRELLSQTNPPIYKDVLFQDYCAYYTTKQGNCRGALALPNFKLDTSKIVSRSFKMAKIILQVKYEI